MYKCDLHFMITYLLVTHTQIYCMYVCMFNVRHLPSSSHLNSSLTDDCPPAAPAADGTDASSVFDVEVDGDAD